MVSLFSISKLFNIEFVPQRSLAVDEETNIFRPEARTSSVIGVGVNSIICNCRPINIYL